RRTEGAIPEARPALDAAIRPPASENPGNHSHDPGHVRRPVNLPATATGTNMTDCHFVRNPPCGENLMGNRGLASVDSVTSRTLSRRCRRLPTPRENRDAQQ